MNYYCNSIFYCNINFLSWFYKNVQSLMEYVMWGSTVFCVRWGRKGLRIVDLRDWMYGMALRNSSIDVVSLTSTSHMSRETESSQLCFLKSIQYTALLCFEFVCNCMAKQPTKWTQNLSFSYECQGAWQGHLADLKIIFPPHRSRSESVSQGQPPPEMVWGHHWHTDKSPIKTPVSLIIVHDCNNLSLENP